MKKMTITEMAKKVAKVINDEVKQDGFDNFKEMRQCYWWEADDIREEVRYIANEIANETPSCNIVVMDDCSVEGPEDGRFRYLEYREFKKMVFALVK